MEREPLGILRWNWVPHTWVDAVQAIAWVVLLAALLPLVRDAVSALETRELRRRVLLIAVAALLARALVPLLPFNWYSGVTNVDLGGPIYSKDTTYMPLPNQLVTFTLGFYGILAFNIATCTVSAVLAWHVARRAGYGERVALLLGLGIALTPMSVIPSTPGSMPRCSGCGRSISSYASITRSSRIGSSRCRHAPSAGRRFATTA